MNEENKIPADQNIPSEKTPEIPSEEIPKEIQQEPQQIAQPTQAYVPKATLAGEEGAGKWRKFRSFVVECKRVLRVTKKPDKTEFKTIVKISGVGMAVIGFIGFFVHFIKELLF